MLLKSTEKSKVPSSPLSLSLSPPLTFSLPPLSSFSFFPSVSLSYSLFSLLLSFCKWHVSPALCLQDVWACSRRPVQLSPCYWCVQLLFCLPSLTCSITQVIVPTNTHTIIMMIIIIITQQDEIWLFRNACVCVYSTVVPSIPCSRVSLLVEVLHPRQCVHALVHCAVGMLVMWCVCIVAGGRYQTLHSPCTQSDR